MLTAAGLGKRYGARLVFRGLNFEVAPGAVAAVVGANGAGKSTLLRIVAGLMRPSAGTVAWHLAGEPAVTKSLQWHCGLAAPDAPIYRELTALENLEFFARVRNLPLDTGACLAHLERLGLRQRHRDLAGDLSSGLRVRLQLAVATLHEPPILLLDEPSANLDVAGRDLVREVIAAQRTCGVALVATNDTRDLELCDSEIRL